MSLKDKLSAKNATIGASAAKTKDTIENDSSAPRTAPGALFAFRGMMEEKDRELDRLRAEIESLRQTVAAGAPSDDKAIQEKEVQLKLAQDEIAGLRLAIEKNQGGLEIPLELLVEVPGRRRRLTAEQYADLKANLSKNPLTTPITVRRLDGGKYEIISGHNRYHIYQELGRPAILAIVIETGEVEAVLQGFFANLMHAALPDVEIYDGIVKIRELFPNITNDGIAELIGVSKSQVGRIAKFGELPPDAIVIARSNPGKLGANAVEELANLANAGAGEKVVDAIRLICEGKLTQDQGIKFAATKEPAGAVKKAKAEPRTFKMGKSKYCEVVRVNKTMRISFASEEEAAAIEEAVCQLLKQRVTKQ